jgi:hypothetical protein
MKHTFKENNLTDHFFAHRAYMSAYSLLFASIRDTEHSVLEIGNASGGMLLVYREFFHSAKIYGIDLQPRPETLKEFDSIFHLQMDAYTDACLTELQACGPFALIVDDGPHSVESQIWCVKNLPQFLSDDGMLIVEDIHHRSTVDLMNGVVPEGFIGFEIDLDRVATIPDDRLFVVTRKNCVV